MPYELLPRKGGDSIDKVEVGISVEERMNKERLQFAVGDFCFYGG